MIIDLIRVEVCVLLVAAPVIVLYGMLNGRINMAGLLGGSNSLIAAHRLQLLAITLFVAFDYIQRVVSANSFAILPDEPQNMLLLLGGSHTLYLGGKGAEQLGWLPSLRQSQQ